MTARRVTLKPTDPLDEVRGKLAGDILIPLIWTNPPLTGNRTRGNPYARAHEVSVAKDAARIAVRAAKVEPIVGANVTLHLRVATKHRRDADGLFPTLKVCQDALVLEGVLPDDSWVCVPRATCEIHPPNGERACMWLELTEVVRFRGDAA